MENLNLIRPSNLKEFIDVLKTLPPNSGILGTSKDEYGHEYCKEFKGIMFNKSTNILELVFEDD